MTKPIHPQCRIVPLRMLQSQSAARFIEGLYTLSGIRRILIHGPAYSNDRIEKTVHAGDIYPPEYSCITIGRQDVDMHVLVADVVVETMDEESISEIEGYCEEFFSGKPYQIIVGQFIKTKPSLSDYIRRGPTHEEMLLGMTDYHERIETTYLSYANNLTENIQ